MELSINNEWVAMGLAILVGTIVSVIVIGLKEYIQKKDSER
jgi:hypothetical protein